MPEYKSPQNESGSERNLLLGLLLMAVILFGSQFFMKKFMPQPPATTGQPTPQQQASPGVAPGATQPAATVSAPNSSKQKPGKQPPATAPSKQAAAESETVVENALYRITFTN